MGINLNDSQFDSKDVKIFNDGEAGLVEDVTVEIQKKGSDDKENAPEYKVIFTDASGQSCNRAYWYLDSSNEYYENQLKSQGKTLKHLIHAVCGKDTEIPEFKDTKDMLDKCMKMVKDGLKKGDTFRVLATYGTTMKPSQYINVRSYVPFIESMSVDASETRLAPGNIDVMERIQEDAEAEHAVAEEAASGNDSDW